MRAFVLGSFVQACCWRVTRLPKAGETFIANALTVEAGGKGLNVAVCMQRLGAQTEIMLGIGADTAGQSLRDLLQQEHVGSTHVYDLGAQSGYGAGLIGSDGQNAIAVYPGPNLLLNADHAQAASSMIVNSDLVYGQFETALDAIAQAFKLAKQHKVRTVLNPSPWQPISAQLLADTDIMIVNEVEAAELFGLPALPLAQGVSATLSALTTLAKQLFSTWQGECLVVTLGEYGSAAFTAAGDMFYQAGFSITAVDTVGAGDAFASGFCRQLQANTDWQTALVKGNACGALVASQQGVLDALPNQAQLTAFL